MSNIKLLFIFSENIILNLMQIPSQWNTKSPKSPGTHYSIVKMSHYMLTNCKYLFLLYLWLIHIIILFCLGGALLNWRWLAFLIFCFKLLKLRQKVTVSIDAFHRLDDKISPI